MNFYNARRRHPGQPLYTLAEIGAFLNEPAARLASLMGKYPGFDAWATSPGNSSRCARKLYRLSDARRWWATVPQCWESNEERSRDKGARVGRADDHEGIAALL